MPEDAPTANPIAYPFANPPAPGVAAEVAPGVHWLRMSLPFALDHINLWALEVLFRRKLDTNQIFFAMGEAIAHLHCLQYDGRLARTVGGDGVARFAPA